MKQNLLKNSSFIELISAIIWAAFFIAGEALITYLRSEPHPSFLEIVLKFAFLSFWFWVFFTWFASKKAEVEAEYDYHMEKGSAAVLRQIDEEEEQIRASYGPRSFRRKTLGLK